MKHLIFILIFFANFFNAQVINKTDSNKIAPKDTIEVDTGRKDSLKIFKPTITDYKFRKEFGEFQVFDTVFTPDKTYIYSQWNNRDNFGRIQYANIGAGFQQLEFIINPEKNLQLLPENKSFGILGIHDIVYYDVKTPTTAFIYHTAMKNGADLNTVYTQNIGKRFNFSLEYMGLRSQGFYQNSLAANNNTLFTGHYISKNSKYEVFAHYLHQNVNNQENGGIEDLTLFYDNSKNFGNRRNLLTNISANSRFAYRRYYLTQEFTPFSVPFKVRHTIFHQGNRYTFQESAPESYYYSNSSELLDYTSAPGKFSKNMSNTVSLIFDNKKFYLEAGARYQNIKAGVNEEAVLTNFTVPGKFSESRVGVVAKLKMDLFRKFNLESDFEASRGAVFGSFVNSRNSVRFEPVQGYFANAHFNLQSALPSFNAVFNASPYKKFNYFLSDFKNETFTEIGGDVNLKIFDAKVSANFIRADNFVYFNSLGQPLQSGSPVNISQISGDAAAHFGKFHGNGRVLFQSVLTNKDLLPLPNFIGRVNLYYQSRMFKNAAEIQTGIKAYFFSKFASRDFFPVTNEYILPNENAYSIGGQPILDAYFNMKVKKMFFFIEAQHFDTTFMKNRSFVAPYYPVYDFRLNIGIVWYLFS